MAIRITLTIPGDPSNPSTAAGRVKEAIDWLHRGEDGDGPATAAEYKAFVSDFLAQCLRHEIRRIETAKRKSELAEIQDIDVDVT